MRENVRVAIWGFGAMGGGMAKMLLNKKGVEIVGVCDNHKDRAGKSIYEVLGVEKGNRNEIIINPNIDEVLTEKCCDVCLCATDSYTERAFPRLKLVLEKKINVISTAEEMSFPKAKNPELAAELNRIAKENGVRRFSVGEDAGIQPHFPPRLVPGRPHPQAEEPGTHATKDLRLDGLVLAPRGQTAALGAHVDYRNRREGMTAAC